MKDLEQDSQLKQANVLRADGGLAEIKFHAFDVTDSTSLRKLTDYLKEAHRDGLDFVINNAGIAMDGFGWSLEHEKHASANKTQMPM